MSLWIKAQRAQAGLKDNTPGNTSLNDETTPLHTKCSAHSQLCLIFIFNRRVLEFL